MTAERQIQAGMAYPCVCCGSTVLSEPPGSYEVCSVCGWEDDPVQLRFPLMAGGANRLSLFTSQRAFRASGKPAVDRDPFWRQLDRRRDFLEPRPEDPDIDISLTGPATTEELYYWGASFWLRRDAQRYLYGRFCPLPRVSFEESEAKDVRQHLAAAIRALSLAGKSASYESLLSYGGKPLLFLAAFRQGDLFELDPRQQIYLQALWYAVTDPDRSEENDELVRALATAALIEES